MSKHSKIGRNPGLLQQCEEFRIHFPGQYTFQITFTLFHQNTVPVRRLPEVVTTRDQGIIINRLKFYRPLNSIKVMSSRSPIWQAS